jgi:hypothetical protein
VTDVATPLTFERYTGNWKGPFEGWLITREELPAPDIRLEQELKKYLSSLHYGEAGDALARDAPAFIHMENTLQEPYEWTEVLSPKVPVSGQLFTWMHSRLT